MLIVNDLVNADPYLTLKWLLAAAYLIRKWKD